MQLICSYDPHRPTILNDTPSDVKKALFVVFQFSYVGIVNTLATFTNILLQRSGHENQKWVYEQSPRK